MTRNSSRLFDKHGRYRSVPDRRCLRCRHVLVGEDELGAYYQVPKPYNMGPLFPGGPDTVLTCNDREHECGGRPHKLPSGALTVRGGARFLEGGVAAGLVACCLSLAGVISIAAQEAALGGILAAISMVMSYAWMRLVIRDEGPSPSLLTAGAVALLGAVTGACLSSAAVCAAGFISTAAMLVWEAGIAFVSAAVVLAVTLSPRRRSGGVWLKPHLRWENRLRRQP